jgi:hypothetical protein
MSDPEPVKKPQANRRPSPRKSPRSDCKAECRKGAMGLGPNIAVSVLDVSQSGARLILKAPLKKGDEAEVILGSGSNKPVKRQSVVVWALAMENGTHAIGFQFRKALSYAETQLVAKP